MKKILVAFMFGLMAIAAHAEATFDQIQVLIEQRQYQAAEKGLEVIIANHPKSAKAFYAMAQAQAGLGNQEKAQKALDLATGLNPTLDFAPASSVASLKEAITPQVKKIEAIEESHFGRNIVLFGMFILFAVAMYFLYSVYARKKEQEDEANKKGGGTCPMGFGSTPPSTPPSTPSSNPTTTAKREYASAYTPTPRPAYQGPTQSVAPAPTYSAPAPTHTTVVNNSSSGSDLLTGVLIGNMLSGSHHDTTRVVEREVIREVPAPSRSSSWDDTPSTPAPSKSSTWDDTPSTPSRSSSWDDDSSSSSKSSSSWSSSSDSSSSSSWDSGSSSSDSGSSSSWD